MSQPSALLEIGLFRALHLPFTRPFFKSISLPLALQGWGCFLFYFLVAISLSYISRWLASGYSMASVLPFGMLLAFPIILLLGVHYLGFSWHLCAYFMNPNIVNLPNWRTKTSADGLKLLLYYTITLALPLLGLFIAFFAVWYHIGGLEILSNYQMGRLTTEAERYAFQVQWGGYVLQYIGANFVFVFLVSPFLLASFVNSAQKRTFLSLFDWFDSWGLALKVYRRVLFAEFLILIVCLLYFLTIVGPILLFVPMMVSVTYLLSHAFQLPQLTPEDLPDQH